MLKLGASVLFWDRTLAFFCVSLPEKITIKTSSHTIFQESNLQFSFDHHWVVHQFDNHRFYKQLAGRSVKGVDFIGIYQQNTLVLMEVKNYIDRYFKDEVNPSQEFLTNQSFHLEKIGKKFDDSLRVIQAVHRAYRKKWWYRLAEKTLFRWIKMERMLHWEFVYWTVAWQLVEAGDLRFILWLEIEKEARQTVEMNNENRLIPVEISSCRKNLFEGNLIVNLITQLT